MTIRCLAMCIFAAGVGLAQTAPAPAAGAQGGRRGPGANPGFGRGGGRGIDLFGRNAEPRLTKQFGLNPTQQNTLHTALASAKVQQQGLREKETTFRTQLAGAVKAGSEGAIESAATDLETLHQQQTSIHAKTLATIYSSLTAAQQAKFLPLMNRELGVPGPMRGPGGNVGRGPRPAGPTPQ
jgi:hypothetical protein